MSLIGNDVRHDTDDDDDLGDVDVDVVVDGYNNHWYNDDHYYYDDDDEMERENVHVENGHHTDE